MPKKIPNKKEVVWLIEYRVFTRIHVEKWACDTNTRPYNRKSDAVLDVIGRNLGSENFEYRAVAYKAVH